MAQAPTMPDLSRTSVLLCNGSTDDATFFVRNRVAGTSAFPNKKFGNEEERGGSRMREIGRRRRSSYHGLFDDHNLLSPGI